MYLTDWDLEAERASVMAEQQGERAAETRETMRSTTDRDGFKCYVYPDGTIIARDGYGRMAWTLYRTDGSYYMTTTLIDAMAFI